MGLITCIDLSAQAFKTSGIVTADTKANLDTRTPDAALGHAQVGLVTSSTVEPTLYLWDNENNEWALSGKLELGTSESIVLDYTNGVLTAEIAQNGATDGQTLQWDNVQDKWIPRSLEANQIAVEDNGAHLTATNVEVALEELAQQIEGIYTLVGVTEDATDLGTFTGGTISDGSNVKGALQELETAVENVTTNSVTPQGTYDSDAAAAAGSPAVPIGGHYYLSATNVYGMAENLIRKRKN